MQICGTVQNISVGLAAYDNNLNLIGYTNPIAPGQKIQDLAFTVNNTTYGYVTIDATGTNNPNNGANNVLIVVDSHNGQVNITNVFWSVYTCGSGKLLMLGLLQAGNFQPLLLKVISNLVIIYVLLVCLLLLVN